MTISIATAPCCRGVGKGHDPNQPGWEQVLHEAAAAGYSGIEPGPLGFVPHEPQRVSAALHMRGLPMVAGTIFDAISPASGRTALLEDTARICALISALPPPPIAGQSYPAPYLTVMDFGAEDRDFDAGHPGRARRLNDREWADMADNISAIAELARDGYGIRAVIHPHAGGFIEFEDEIARIAADIPAGLAGFCLNTGHLYYGGMDPVETLRRYADRLDYSDFKDIDRAVFDRVMEKGIRFFDACAEGVMCPIGDGCIDYPAIRSLLSELDYAGFITVEQERDPRNSGGAMADVKRSRDYLKTAGF